MTEAGLSAAEFKQRLETGESLHLLDVREADEFADFNLGGLNIPTGELPDRLGELQDWQSQEVVVVCYYGSLSDYASRYLNRRGFPKAKNVEGGLEAYLSL
ncbi:MAG: rhodanese-like domain-containing protein [Cytophagaceae bacterium]|nr:rhodanese-like domain-containing protein [Cytophagaceae bacterium]